jgi:hypothetical protein
MLCRRQFIAVTAAFAAAPCAFAATQDALPFPPLKPLSFRVLRKGSEIGTHAITFSGTPQTNFTATVDVQLRVRIAFIPVFHYTHHTVERWENGRFVSLESKTDYDGEPAFATAKTENGQLIVEGSKAPRYTAPPGALPATHWNSAELKSAMINPENGLLLTPKITDMGSDPALLASGSKIPATRFAWRGKDVLDLWYQPDGVWAALSAVAKDGSTLMYERI